MIEAILLMFAYFAAMAALCGALAGLFALIEWLCTPYEERKETLEMLKRQWRLSK